MKDKILLVLILFLGLNAFSQNKHKTFNANIVFQRPDTSIWNLIKETEPNGNSKGSIVFKRKAIIDSLGRPVEPMMAIVIENLHDSLDVVEYSVNYFGHAPYHLKYTLLGGYPEYSADKHSIIFNCEYIREGTIHTILLGFIVYKGIGLQIICDCTDSVYPKAQKDMRNFIKSVYLKM